INVNQHRRPRACRLRRAISNYCTMSYPPQIPPQVPPPFYGQNVVDYAGARRCPGCGSGPLGEPKFTWWGGLIGHKILGVERCEACRKWWVKKTGAPGGTRVAIYMIAGLVLGILLAVMFAMSNSR